MSRTMKENFLRLMRNDNPTWVGDPWDCFNENKFFRPALFDGGVLCWNPAQPGAKDHIDAWGVEWEWPFNQPGATPLVTYDNCVVKDITQWEKYLKFPDVDAFNWAPFDAQAAHLDRENKLVMVANFSGMFEFSHLVMPFDEALCNYIEEPEAMFDMLSAYTDWKIKCVAASIEHTKPDIIHHHDDWGSKHALFLSPEIWRKIIKPQYERFYGFIKSKGVLVQHHSDCFNEGLENDMVDIGIDMWQGAIPQNNIKKMIENTKGKLCVMGGMDMQLIDLPEANEEAIRAEVRRAIDEYVPLGSFIPCVANIFPIHKNVEAIINDELRTYGAAYAEKNFK